MNYYLERVDTVVNHVLTADPPQNSEEARQFVEALLAVSVDVMGAFYSTQEIAETFFRVADNCVSFMMRPSDGK